MVTRRINMRTLRLKMSTLEASFQHHYGKKSHSFAPTLNNMACQFFWLEEHCANPMTGKANGDMSRSRGGGDQTVEMASNISREIEESPTPRIL